MPCFYLALGNALGFVGFCLVPFMRLGGVWVALALGLSVLRSLWLSAVRGLWAVLALGLSVLRSLWLCFAVALALVGSGQTKGSQTLICIREP